MPAPIRNTNTDDCWEAFLIARRDCIMAWKRVGWGWETMAAHLDTDSAHVRRIWTANQPTKEEAMPLSAGLDPETGWTRSEKP